MTRLQIDGMTCTSCAEHVRSALQRVPGVRSVSVSYPDRTATLQVDAATSTSALAAAVAAVGYSARHGEAPSCVIFAAGRPSRQGARRAGAAATGKRPGTAQALHIAVIGSGGGAMAAALKAAELGARSR